MSPQGIGQGFGSDQGDGGAVVVLHPNFVPSYLPGLDERYVDRVAPDLYSHRFRPHPRGSPVLAGEETQRF